MLRLEGNTALESGVIGPAVWQTRKALQSEVRSVQWAGLHAAMMLLHAALLIRQQPHQVGVQQHSPPTGSTLLNELYSQVGRLGWVGIVVVVLILFSWLSWMVFFICICVCVR